MPSFGDVLREHKGIGPGFDTLRLGLSVAILCFHSILTSYGLAVDLAVWQSPLSRPASAVLPMFFALSGFLVMGSALRTGDLRKFIILRVLRIVPALSTEITLSALFLGILFTTLSIGEYLTHPDFFAYFGSLIGRVRVVLPGVFESNPFPSVVNISLWTITPELLCYVILAVLMLTGIFRQRVLMALVVGGAVLAYMVSDLVRGVDIPPIRPKPQMLLLAFLAGNILYLWRDRIPYSSVVFWVSLALGLLLCRVSGLAYLSLVFLSYCIVFLGLTSLPKVPVLSRGDYSYGIYLYAFPIQQMVSSLLPAWREWYWNILFALPLTVLVAMASWTFIEKPALDYRARLGSSKDAHAGQWNFARFLLLFALMAYGLLLMWSADMLSSTRTTTARAVFSMVFLGAVAALITSIMAAFARNSARRIQQVAER